MQDGARWLAFEAPLAVLEARDASSVRSLLREADSALAAGRFVAGYLAYEAAGAFGLATQAPDADGPPLAGLGVFEAAVLALVHAPEPQIAPVVAALLAFRAIYHLLPFALGCVLLATVELGRRSARDQST